MLDVVFFDSNTTILKDDKKYFELYLKSNKLEKFALFTFKSKLDNNINKRAFLTFKKTIIKVLDVEFNKDKYIDNYVFDAELNKAYNEYRKEYELRFKEKFGQSLSDFLQINEH